MVGAGLGSLSSLYFADGGPCKSLNPEEWAESGIDQIMTMIKGRTMIKHKLPNSRSRAVGDKYDRRKELLDEYESVISASQPTIVVMLVAWSLYETLS